MTSHKFFRSYLPIRLPFNTIAASSDLNRASANLDGEGKSYPSEEFPRGSIWQPHGPDRNRILFELSSRWESMCVEAQLIRVPYRTYQGLAILGASVNGDFQATLKVQTTENATMDAPLQLTSWLATQAAFPSNSLALRCSHLHVPECDIPSCQPCLWLQIIIFSRTLSIETIILDDNPNMQIFALTGILCADSESWAQKALP